MTFAQAGQRFELSDERIENEEAYQGQATPYFYFGYRNGQPYLNLSEAEQRQLLREEVNTEQSILSQRRDPDSYPEITYLGDALGKIRLYREWSFGRFTPPRLPQPADLPNDFLAEDGRNLGLVLNSLRTKLGVKKKLLEALRELNEVIDDFDTLIEGGTVQLFMQEGNISIPATRLSDGTLRYLCLLAIVCHPNPPPLVCIEEPELGLHPDILPPLAKLLLEASERCQLIVTTHSEVLVDALTDSPESILVCEKPKDRTEMRRLERKTSPPGLNATDWVNSGAQANSGATAGESEDLCRRRCSGWAGSGMPPGLRKIPGARRPQRQDAEHYSLWWSG